MGSRMAETAWARRAVVATFAVGLAIGAVAAALALTQAPPRVVKIGAPGRKALGVNGGLIIGRVIGDGTICQAGEVLPAGISAIRLSIWAFFGAHVRVMAYRGSQLLTEGSRSASWTGDSVTVPVRALAHSASDVRICIAIGPNQEPLEVLGNHTKPQQAAVKLAAHVSPADPVAKGEQRAYGRLAIEYLAPGDGSWWARVLAVARHMGLGRAYAGTWIALLVAALMLAVGALAMRLTLRELR